MGSYRHFVALSFAGVCAISGCGNLIGLGEYSVADHADDGGAGVGIAGAGGRSSGSGGSVGGAGAEIGDGGSSGGVPDESAGAAGEGGAGDAGGTGGSGAMSGASGAAGSGATGGATATCSGSCNDGNDCTADSCKSGTCVHEPLDVGAACGVSRSCDAQAVCVRCRDTAAGTAQDEGCSPSAPVCLGTGLDAVCGGCLVATDCNDNNDCTTESCNAGKCVFTPVAAGSTCSTGVCNGTASAEKCVACADTSPGSAQDAGCSSAKPVCDASGTPACFECNTGSDCATDNVSCTVETCTNHVCTHVATDSLCPGSGDVCKPNKCDAVSGCKQVDVSSQTVLIDADTVGNGSFEVGTHPATGWGEDGKYWITKDCGTTGCTPGSNSGATKASVGKALAWLGGINDAGIGDLSQTLTLPVGTRTLHIQADTNFQTQKNIASNNDLFQVRLMDASYVQIGSPLVSKSALDAQTGTTHPWSLNGVDVTTDVSAYAGKIVSVSFWSSCDTTAVTDFFVDNVRVTATICK